jgi:hypothetical protein
LRIFFPELFTSTDGETITMEKYSFQSFEE